MDDCAASVALACDSCPAPSAGEVYETIIDGRLHWVFSHACADGSVESMGWDATPDELRQAILDQCGTYRLRLSGPDAGRATVLKVLREGGKALSDVSAAFADLSGPGMTGTEAELRLMAGRLSGAGVQVTVRRDA